MGKNDAIYRLLVHAARAVLTTGGSVSLEVGDTMLYLPPSEVKMLDDKHPGLSPAPQCIVGLYELEGGGVDTERVLLEDIDQVTVKLSR